MAKPRAEVSHQVVGAVGRLAAVGDLIRDRLDWRQPREVDLGMMRWIRRASALTPVLGAGVTIGAGTPSWATLLRALLVEAMEKGRPIFGEWKREKRAGRIETTYRRRLRAGPGDHRRHRRRDSRHRAAAGGRSALRGHEADAVALQAANRRHLEFGVQPIWFEDFGEIPSMVRALE